jgi:hypothetical protein
MFIPASYMASSDITRFTNNTCFIARKEAPMANIARQAVLNTRLLFAHNRETLRPLLEAGCRERHVAAPPCFILRASGGRISVTSQAYR